MIGKIGFSKRDTFGEAIIRCFRSIDFRRLFWRRFEGYAIQNVNICLDDDHFAQQVQPSMIPQLYFQTMDSFKFLPEMHLESRKSQKEICTTFLTRVSNF
jgi:hypothetical protein